MRDTSPTQATRMQHEWDTSNTSATPVQHQCYTKDTSATRVKNFDFDSNTSKNIFLQTYIYKMATERLQGKKQVYSMNYLLEMPCFHAKIRLESAPQKL